MPQLCFMSIFALPFFIYEIFICFLLSLFFLKCPGIINKLLPVFLLFLLGVEYYCAWLKKLNLPNNNIYNFWFPVEYFFYGYLIATYITEIKRKRISWILIVVYIVFTIVYYSFKEDMYAFSSLTYLAGSVITLVIILFKLYEILNQEIIFNPLKSEIFWFCTGILIVNLGGFFHFGATNYINANNKPLHKALQSLNIYLTEFQYCCFVIYFFCKWKYQKSHT